MSYFDISDAQFNPELRRLETTDPNHADVFNALYGQLIKNDVALKSVTDQALLAEFATNAEVKEVIDSMGGGTPEGGDEGGISEDEFATDEEVQELIDNIW